jgi:hypothetical protein
MTRFVIIALLVLMSACTVPREMPRPGTPDAPPAPLPENDTCGAGPFAGMVGQDSTALERVLIMREVRVIRPGMPVTADFSAERINFLINETGRIAQITCG